MLFQTFQLRFGEEYKYGCLKSSLFLGHLILPRQSIYQLNRTSLVITQPLLMTNCHACYLCFSVVAVMLVITVISGSCYACYHCYQW